MRTTPFLKRLTAILTTFTTDIEGVTWYATAGDIVTELAERYQVSRECAAGVIAVTSPRLQWKRNIQVSHEVLAGLMPRGLFKANARKAMAIRNGAEPLDVIKGPKTRAFYRAIMGDPDAVVIDVWMLRVLKFTRKLTTKAYDLLADIIRQAAKGVGMTPASFQAVVWVAVRGRAS